MDATRFRWEDLAEDSPIPLLTRRRYKGEQIMLAKVLLKKGCQVKSHYHENEQFAYVMSGRARFGRETEGSSDYHEVEVAAGDVIHLRSNLPHSCTALEDTLILDMFSPATDQMGIDRQRDAHA